PLSVNRAAATRDYLVSRGVASKRISIDGRGEQEPIADNATAAGRAKNRRVEIFVAEATR
ncbi:OmpA family protein, partial [Bacillus cereus group sp. BC327]|uniref:OmpA family protein n=1 Tax=Bacillus cereus group sp. BC327 TaxID=3445309 RepID=UPI003F2259F0